MTVEGQIASVELSITLSERWCAWRRAMLAKR